jgi:hypothetical protein
MFKKGIAAFIINNLSIPAISQLLETQTQECLCRVSSLSLFIDKVG